jgi:two-component system CheB/CheR fusion protein
MCRGGAIRPGPTSFDRSQVNSKMSHATANAEVSRRATDQAAAEVDRCARASGPQIFVVDDEYFARQEMKDLLEDAGWAVEAFASCELFLAAFREGLACCIVLDMHLTGMGGLELLARLAATRMPPPVVMVSGDSGVAEAVQSMKEGALDFVEKPIVREKLVSSVRKALAQGAAWSTALASRDVGQGARADLTPRERQVMEMVLAGRPSKNIAADLGISQRTVENHRASIMQKTNAGSLPALARMMMCESCPLVPMRG